ncbi:MAG: hypothetical protein K8R21_12080, partial [Leptospira sp.]|nr:hypothetical protein [Leptospira sp.]
MNFVDLQNFLREIIRRKSFVIFLSFAIVYKLIFNSFTGDFLFKYVFRNYSTGSFQGNVTKFSLFFGIEVRNLIIASGKDFDNKSIVEAERLSLSYNIPLLFLGRLRISEIAFIKPKINLLEKKGEWNVAKLFPAGKAEPRKEPEKESSGDEINLYVPVSAFLNFHLEDLDLSVEKEKGANFFNAKIEGFTFRFLVDTKRFRKIPLNTGAVSLLDKFEMKLNPDREIKVQFSDNSKSLKNPFRMTWILYQDSKVNPPVFYSKMDIGAKNVPIFVRNKILSPFGFSLYYDLNYIPKEDLLTLQDFKISFNEDVWLECKAKVHNALKSDRSLAFEITRSSIRLAPISKVLKDFPGMPSMNLDGVINLAPIRADGKFADLGVKGNIRIKDLVFQQGKSPAQKVKSLDFVFDMELDLVKNEKPSAANPFPYLKIVRIPKLEMNYNGFNISLKGEIATGRNIDLAVSFDKMKIAQYAPGQEGTVKGSVEIKAKNFAYLDTSSKIHVDSYKYTSGVSKSGAHNIDLYFKSGITFKENWALTEMPFEKLNLVLK